MSRIFLQAAVFGFSVVCFLSSSCLALVLSVFLKLSRGDVGRDRQGEKEKDSETKRDGGQELQKRNA